MAMTCSEAARCAWRQLFGAPLPVSLGFPAAWRQLFGIGVIVDRLIACSATAARCATVSALPVVGDSAVSPDAFASLFDAFASPRRAASRAVSSPLARR
jgi:Na+(H+)/acetate symporter ActP